MNQIPGAANSFFARKRDFLVVFLGRFLGVLSRFGGVFPRFWGCFRVLVGVFALCGYLFRA